MSVLPVNFIATDEAIQELVGQDAEWQQLNRHWSDAQGSAKETAHRDLSDHQDELTNELGSSILSGALVPVALKRMGGRWVEHNLPHEYWETSSSDLALWTGKVDPRGLSPDDRWIGESPLCFRREAFHEWMRARAATAEENAQARAVRIASRRGRRPDQQNRVKDGIAKLYPNGFPLDGKIEALIEELKGHGVATNRTTVNRALGRR